MLGTWLGPVQNMVNTTEPIRAVVLPPQPTCAYADRSIVHNVAAAMPISGSRDEAHCRCTGTETSTPVHAFTTRRDGRPSAIQVTKSREASTIATTTPRGSVTWRAFLGFINRRLVWDGSPSRDVGTRRRDSPCMVSTQAQRLSKMSRPRRHTRTCGTRRPNVTSCRRQPLRALESLAAA